MRTYREMLDRVAELKHSWADATGDSPEDFQLSADDWRVGLDDEEAAELVELLAFIEEVEAEAYTCAECGTTKATTYVVTFTDGDRTEVCRSCDDALRATGTSEPLHLDERQLTGTAGGDWIPCPDRQCNGHVVEVDVAMRWNDLTAYEDGIVASTDGSYDFGRREEDGFICSSCLRPIRSDALDNADIIYT